MFELMKFKKLKARYDLRWFEWVFIACLEDGVKLVGTKGPEAALSKSMDREKMESDVKYVLNSLPSQLSAVMYAVLVKDAPLKQVGAEYGISAEKTRGLLTDGIKRVVERRSLQRRLIGAADMDAEEEKAERERAVIQEGLRAELVAEIKKRKERREREVELYLYQELRYLRLPPTTLRKLQDLGLATIKDLLEMFPYNMETNELEHFLESDSRLNKIDYFDVWNALYERNLLIRMPVLPKSLLSGAERSKLEERDGVILVSSPSDDDSLDVLGLSTRAHNCLDRAKIRSYKRLREWCDDRSVGCRAEFETAFQKIRNLRRKDYEEALERLDKYGWLDFLI